MSCPPSVTVGGVEYIAEFPYGNELPAALIGEPIGPTPQQPTAPCSGVSGCTAPEDGSTLRRVVGYEPFFRLTGVIRGRWVLFEVERNSAAKHGSDLYDIRGKVRSITIQHGYAGAVGSIDAPVDVARFVDLVLAAPVGPRRGGTVTDSYSLTINLNDGTETRTSYLWPMREEAKFNLEPGAAFEEMLAATVR